MEQKVLGIMAQVEAAGGKPSDLQTLADVARFPVTVKSGLRAAYASLLALPFAHLLLAHGEPVVSDGHEQLTRFAEGA